MYNWYISIPFFINCSCLLKEELYWKSVKRGVLNKCSLRHLILRKKEGINWFPLFLWTYQFKDIFFTNLSLFSLIGNSLDDLNLFLYWLALVVLSSLYLRCTLSMDSPSFVNPFGTSKKLLNSNSTDSKAYLIVIHRIL